jgi:hypothetical protein
LSITVRRGEQTQKLSVRPQELQKAAQWTTHLDWFVYFYQLSLSHCGQPFRWKLA